MDGLKALKAAVVVMGVLIVLGTVTLVVVAVNRAATVPASRVAATLRAPAGSRIVGLAAVGPRLAVALHGGGPDRVVLVDPATGREAGRITLAP